MASIKASFIFNQIKVCIARVMFTTFFFGAVGVMMGFGNGVPEIQNISIKPDADNRIIEIVYDLLDKEADQIAVTLFYSLDSGKTCYQATAVGDIGFPVLAGNQRKITWHVPENVLGDYFTLKLIADDNQPMDFQRLNDQVDTTRIAFDLQRIVGERNLQSESARTHLKEVRNFLDSSFNASGLYTLRNKFEMSNNTYSQLLVEHLGIEPDINPNHDKGDFENIIAEIPGHSSQDPIIVCAHYDSTEGSDGYDDNASGVVGMLEVMRILSTYSFDRSVKFIAFDGEEKGSWGSINYLLDGPGKNEKIAGLINLDVIGSYSEEPYTQMVPDAIQEIYPEVYQELADDDFKADFALVISNEVSESLHETFIKASNECGLKQISILAYRNGQDFPALAASDHAPFWHAGLPAIHVGVGGETRNENIDTAYDTEQYSEVHLGFVSSVVKATIVTIGNLAGAHHTSCSYFTASF